MKKDDDRHQRLPRLNMRIIYLSALIAAATLQAHQLAGQPAPQPPADPPTEVTTDPDAETKPSLRFNVPIKTAGGTQFWTDFVWRDGYRIQRNSLTSHWRLVDGGDVRRAWGTRKQCDQALADLSPVAAKGDAAVGDAAKPKHVVVLLHGLMRTHRSMKPLEAALKTAEHPNVVRFSYASTRSSIRDHAMALRNVLDGFPPNTEFSFIGHSMGNIIVRHLLNDLQRDKDPQEILPRCQSMVMLGPPNQGAAIARRLAPTGVFEWVTGKGGMELGAQWEELEKNLATPHFPFLIIAGDVSDSKVQNPLVDGSGDFVVSLEEAKLEGAEAFHTVPSLHSVLMNDEEARKLTIEFLDSHRS